MLTFCQKIIQNINKILRSYYSIKELYMLNAIIPGFEDRQTTENKTTTIRIVTPI